MRDRIKMHCLHSFIMSKKIKVCNLLKIFHIHYTDIYKTYEYFNIPSNLEVQIITLLSALPEANFLPSFA